MSREPEPAAAAMERVVVRLATDVADLGTDAARAILVAANATHVTTIRQIAAYLDARPDALLAGVSDCPIGLLRVINKLVDDGYAVAAPTCAHCGRTARHLRNAPDGRLCYRCAARTARRTCERCGKVGRPAARRADGVICYSCYEKDPEAIAECAACGRRRRVVKRLVDGTGLCDTCHERPPRLCARCGQLGRIKVHQPGGPVCERCYRSPARQCGRCGRDRPIARRGDTQNPDLCDACYQGPLLVCRLCGRLRPCTRTRTGQPTCKSCMPRRRRACCRCGRLRPVNAEWPIGPVCTTCYESIRNDPQMCAQCQIAQPLIAVDDHGRRICGPCAGVAVDYFCRRCGDGGRQYADGECVRCVLAQRLDGLLASGPGGVPAQLTPVRQALGNVEHPITVIGWLRRSEGARLLARLARMEEPITHRLLDELPPSRHLYYIRDVLVHTGVLEQRNEYLERVGPWLDDVFVGAPGDHVRLVRPFANWYVLRRARRRAKGRPFTAGSHAIARSLIRTALAFLAWLADRGQTLDSITQADVDQWLRTGSTGRYEVRYFLRWAASRTLCSGLTVPQRPVRAGGTLLEEDERWGQLKRCLDDQTLPRDVGAAGALISLYGLTISAITRLTVDHLVHRDEGVYLVLDKSPVVLPPRLANVLIGLAGTARSSSAVGRATSRTDWLFPGRAPGRHISATHLNKKLIAAGIRARPTRNGALFALAEDLPAAILADLLGLHVTTAERWAKFARRDWADYLQARTAVGEGAAQDMR